MRLSYGKMVTKMSISKKLSSCLICSAMVLSLASCSNNLVGDDISYAAVIDGAKIPAGVFISKQMDAFYEAMYYVDPEETAEETTTSSADAAETTATTAFTDKVIEGKAVRDWINDKATESIREYAAVESKFDELGLSFQDNEKEKVTVYMDSFWESYGKMYEDIGISENSQILISLNSQKQSLLFKHFYGEGGENEISESDVKAYLTDNNARINYIKMELKDGEGNLLKSEGKAEIMEMAKDYVERAKNGEDFNVLLKEYNDYYEALQQAAADTTEDTAADTEDTDEEFPDNTTVISKDGYSPSEAVVSKVFDGTVKDGDVVIVEEDEVYYVVAKLDLFADEEYYADNELSARYALKGDEFDAMIDSWVEAQTFEKNEAAYKKYKIEKFME